MTRKLHTNFHFPKLEEVDPKDYGIAMFGIFIRTVERIRRKHQFRIERHRLKNEIHTCCVCKTAEPPRTNLIKLARMGSDPSLLESCLKCRLPCPSLSRYSRRMTPKSHSARILPPTSRHSPRPFCHTRGTLLQALSLSRTCASLINNSWLSGHSFSGVDPAWSGIRTFRRWLRVCVSHNSSLSLVLCSFYRYGSRQSTVHLMSLNNYR